MPSDGVPLLGDGVVAVGVLRIDDAASHETALAEDLDPSERARAGAFHFAPDRRRYVIVRGTLRRVLGTLLGIPPAAVLLTEGSHGKPALDQGSPIHIEFNVSHTDDLAVLGFASAIRLGVDVERDRTNLDIDGLTRRFFSPAESALVRDSADRTSTFFAIWTRKEACVKGTGMGLSVTPESFSVDISDQHAVDLGDHGTWATAGIDVGPAHTAAVAAERATFELTSFDPILTIAG